MVRMGEFELLGADTGAATRERPAHPSRQRRRRRGHACPAARPRPRSMPSSTACTSAATSPARRRSGTRRSPPPSPTWRRWGPKPGEAYVVLGLPPDLERGGMHRAARRHDRPRRRDRHRPLPAATSAAPGELFLAITVVGHASDPAALVQRAGAQPGDVLVLTGEIGGAAAGLRAARQTGPRG